MQMLFMHLHIYIALLQSLVKHYYFYYYFTYERNSRGLSVKVPIFTKNTSHVPRFTQPRVVSKRVGGGSDVGGGVGIREGVGCAV